MKKHLLGSSLFLFSLVAFTQTSSTAWKTNFEPRKVFIENKSQFNNHVKEAGSEILFGSERNHCCIYFTKSGLVYRFEKNERKHVEEDGYKTEKNREQEEHEIKTTTNVVQLTWQNSNPSVEIIPLEKASDYFSYEVNGKGVNHVNAFSKLLYKNIYPGIDAEYVFHAQEGIKYSLIVHPGADISQVKMKYSGVSKISADESGNIHFKTLFGDIIDHAPITFYEFADNATIESHFIQNGKTISFSLGNYDKTQTVIVDPWTTVPTLPSANSAFYIKTDTSGNAYVYGGDSPFRLVKYNSTGAIQWTYNTSWTGGDWFGALATNRNGNCFITRGSEAALTKIDSSGAFKWTNSPPGAPANAIEYWTLDFNCDQTELYVGGTKDVPFSFTFRGTLFKMNINNGSVISSVDVVFPTFGFGSIGFNEIRSMCAAPNGNMYYLTLDTVGAVSPAMTVQFGKRSGYAFPYYLPYSNGGTGQGQNNIRVTSNYIYTTDGVNVHKRDINTGVIIDSAVIASGSLNNNSGVAIDSCGNVYVGAQDKVLKYDADLNLITTAATPEAVYDISISRNGDVLASGHNFAVALNMSACTQIKQICYLTMLANATSTNANCGQCNGTAIATPVNGTAPFSYLWSNGQTTQTANSLCAGPYTVTITDVNSNTATAAVTISQTGGAGSASISTGTPIMCAGDSSQICLGATYTSYLWNTGATTQCIIAHNAGNYYVTVTDANGCTASSNHLAINVYPLPPVSISVNGDTLTAFNAVTYQWYLNGSAIPGATSNVYVANQNGNYTVAVTDTNGCTVLSNPTYMNGTGINELLSEGKISVYPNPLQKGNWHLEISKEWMNAVCEIFDAGGRLIYKADIKNFKSEIQLNVASGIYMMKLKAGEKIASVELVKL